MLLKRRVTELEEEQRETQNMLQGKVRPDAEMYLWNFSNTKYSITGPCIMACKHINTSPHKTEISFGHSLLLSFVGTTVTVFFFLYTLK